jgi:hypothetical protein
MRTAAHPAQGCAVVGAEPERGGLLRAGGEVGRHVPGRSRRQGWMTAQWGFAAGGRAAHVRRRTPSVRGGSDVHGPRAAHVRRAGVVARRRAGARRALARGRRSRAARARAESAAGLDDGTGGFAAGGAGPLTCDGGRHRCGAAPMRTGRGPLMCGGGRHRCEAAPMRTGRAPLMCGGAESSRGGGPERGGLLRAGGEVGRHVPGRSRRQGRMTAQRGFAAGGRAAHVRQRTPSVRGGSDAHGPRAAHVRRGGVVARRRAGAESPAGSVDGAAGICRGGPGRSCAEADAIGARRPGACRAQARRRTLSVRGGCDARRGARR